MSSSSGPTTGKRVKLTVQAAGPFTELRVLDARLRPVPLDGNTGSGTASVAPGLYEVGFRVAEGWEIKHIVAAPDRDEVRVEQDKPAPSAVRSAVVAEQAQPRYDNVNVSVLLTGATNRPAGSEISVTLVRGDDEGTAVPDLTPSDPFCFRFLVPPGNWRLRLDEPTARPPFEVPLTVCADYRLDVVAPLLPSDTIVIDVDRLRVRLVSLNDPTGMTPHLTEFEDAALAALGSDRALYGSEFERLIENLVNDKALNPMLGIMAAHLCNRGGSELAFQERLLAKLELLTGGPAPMHPDVAALRLRLRLRTGQSLEDEAPVPFPPLLAASWSALVEAARERPGLIPVGSISERMADRLWSSALWVAWSAEPAPAVQVGAAPSTRSVAPAIATRPTPASTDIFPTLKDTIVAGLNHAQLRDWFREARNASRIQPTGLASDEELAITPAEVAVGRALFPVAASEDKQGRFAHFAESVKRGTAAPSFEVDLNTVSKSLGLPPTTVARAAGSLADKLQAMALNFKLDL
jgi:hypothetical protein